MSKKAIRKDFYMEIKKTYNRFLSIFLIVALGVAFFSGIRAAKPDMQLSADRFFDENNLMDIQILGTMGLTKDDVEAVQKLEGVKEVNGGYSIDVLSYLNEKQSVLKLISLSDQINKAALSEGKMPTSAEECVIDQILVDTMNVKVGDTIKVTSGNSDDLSASIVRDTFTVSGIASTPYYLSLERGASQIGNGNVYGFILIPEDNFCMDVYTEITATVKGAIELISYRKDYTALVDPAVSNIEEIKEERSNLRYESIKKDADDEIQKAEKELADAEQEANEKLEDAASQIADGEQEIKDGKKEIQDGKKELKKAKKEILEAEEALKDGKEQYQTGKADIEAAKVEYQTGKEELSTKQKELSEAEKELTKQEQALREARLVMEEKKQQLEASKDLITPEMYQDASAQIQEAEQPLLLADQEISAGKDQMVEGKAALASGQNELAKAEKQIVEGEKKLKDSLKELADGEQKINDGTKEIEVNEKKLDNATKDIKKGERELKDAKTEYGEAKLEAATKIADAKEELESAKDEINDLKTPEWYVLGREKMQVIEEYGQNAERIGAIGEVFPVIFFLVAALVCLTTMTRMVEDQRVQIGTLKALGYSKASIASKYILYAAIASITGGATGTIIGQKLLPIVIVGAYQIMYPNLPYALTPFHYSYGISSILVVAGCTVFAAFFSCFREMNETAAQLMRPVAPKAGKRVLLERVTILWKHLDFTKKASIRNLFRYKKRFFMTVIGIAGCMSLILVGFGVRDSVYNIATLQYDQLFHYKGSTLIKDSASSKKREKLYQYLDQNRTITEYGQIYQASVTIRTNEKEKTAYLIVPMEADTFDTYVQLQNRQTKETYELKDAGNGIVLTEKVASLLDVTIGDKLTIQIGDTKKAELTIRKITENYAMHYLYMSKETYQAAFLEEPEPNTIFFNTETLTEKEEEELGEEMLTNAAVSQISFNSDTRGSIEGMLESLNVVVWVLILSAGLLAFVVLYNLNNININERKRELATLKVLGFYDNEVASYVYRENVMLTLIGILAGMVLGVILHRYVILTAEIDMLMFGRNISPISHLYSAGLTLLFSGLINWIMYYKLKTIDMIESLKSIE